MDTSDSTDPPATDLMRCLPPAVTECLCDLVVARKSTEQARSDAIWLVMLLSRANSATKALALKLLRAATADLTKIITGQLKVGLDRFFQQSLFLFSLCVSIFFPI